MDTNSFLPKQLTNENGVIPYQLHKAELVKILDNASNYLDFLNVKDDDGLSNKDKIIRLFEFRIPYYVGPLYKDESKDTNAWVVRKGEGKVYPWNFDEMIDTSSKKRIRDCREYFDSVFEKESKDTLLKWLEIVEEATVTEYHVTKKSEAAQIFAFQNDRGKSLSNPKM